jgi:linoleoyl-CoA desaturase
VHQPPSVAVHSGKVKFASDSGFHAELKRRVQEYFKQTGLSPTGDLRMYVKTGSILLWFAASYFLLVFVATTWWTGALFATSLAFAMAGTGFAIQHDANHGAYSSKDAVNRLMGLTLDVLGASSYVWHWKHNMLHHTYPNLIGADDDINIQPFARLSPDQPRRRFHRAQQFYMWLLYGFLMPKWHLFDDFHMVAQGRIARNRMPRPRGWRLVEMVAGKAAFFAWAVVVPALYHRFWVVLAFYGATAFLLGIILAVVFQLAHCVEEAEFAGAPADTARLAGGWAEHQVRNTVDFARRNPVLAWYLGGLNFQIEHHLFPKICHVHYPRMSTIVEEVCGEYGIPYAAHKRVLGAVASHWLWLRRMGRPVVR